MTSNGGSGSFNHQSSNGQSPNPQPSSTSTHTLTPALVLALLSQLEKAGECDSLSQDRKLMEGTLAGQKRLALNSWLSTFCRTTQQQEHTSSSMATTWLSLRGGGMDAVETGKPTLSSGTYKKYHTSRIAQYTLTMFPANRTQPTNHPEVSTCPCSSFSPILQSPRKSPPMSLTLTTPLSTLGRMLDVSQSCRGASAVWKISCLSSSNVEGKLRNLPLPAVSSTAKKCPGPYPKNLTLTPSLLHPHCMARDRLHQWLPLSLQHQVMQSWDSLPLDDQRRVAEVMMCMWEEDT